LTQFLSQSCKSSSPSYGKIPAWHPGAGGDAFIFADEIIIE